MNNITQIFNRLDIQNIREYLMYGADLLTKDARTYEERLLTQEDKMLELLRLKFPALR